MLCPIRSNHLQTHGLFVVEPDFIYKSVQISNAFMMKYMFFFPVRLVSMIFLKDMPIFPSLVHPVFRTTALVIDSLSTAGADYALLMILDRHVSLLKQ